MLQPFIEATRRTCMLNRMHRKPFGGNKGGLADNYLANLFIINRLH